MDEYTRRIVRYCESMTAAERKEISEMLKPMINERFNDTLSDVGGHLAACVHCAGEANPAIVIDFAHKQRTEVAAVCPDCAAEIHDYICLARYDSEPVVEYVMDMDT